MLRNVTEKHWLTQIKEISISIITVLLLCVIWTLYGVSMLLNMAILLFSVYQTATDWATHPITRGAVYNVSRKREKQVAEMMQSKYWENLYG